MKVVVPLFVFLSLASGQFAPTTGEIAILGIRVSFLADSDKSTTGDGTFLTASYSGSCGPFVLDPPPHNKAYFEAHLKAVDSYFRSVSNGHFGLDLDRSEIMPAGDEASYTLDTTMAYFHPYGNESLRDPRLAELFQSAISEAYENDDTLNFDDYDVIVIFHAGIGQDFSLPFLDPTPEDIPSMYVDSDFLFENLKTAGIETGGGTVSSGIILPETQNHLLFDVAQEIFSGTSDPCDYQFGLTGTFALMLGFAIGLPPLWDTEGGRSGVGVFALMDQGSNNGRGVIPAPPDAWTRIYAGWETATVIRPTNDVQLFSRDSLADQIVRVDITESEYFLIENRNNWILDEVDIDSLRRRNWDRENMYARILRDSIGARVDPETSVIDSVPNYDLGLPGSGLLIWHVDELKITEGWDSYSVNADREHRAIDLEESDGAQDMGYPNILLFANSSTGYRWDMWFADNDGFYFANPGFEGRLPSFGPDTYPNTRSNRGSDSYVEINNISDAGKAMRFTVTNSLLADGFPDTSLHIHFFYDFTGDGIPEIIGGRDSLWIAPNRPAEHWTYFASRFLELPSDSFQVLVTNYDTPQPKLVAIVDKGDSLGILVYYLERNSLNFVLDWSQMVAADLPPLSHGFADSDAVDLAWGISGFHVTQNNVSSYLRSDATPFDPTWVANATVQNPVDNNLEIVGSSIQRGGGLLVDTGEAQRFGLEDFTFQSISMVDLDLDGRVEILATDRDGSVYAINTNFTFESGFPIAVNASSTVLARDLFGDSHPELVVQTDSRDILVLSWRGKERYRLANPKGSELRTLSQYQGRNCIATESAIWLFDSTTATNGNEWSYVHRDPTNHRMFEAILELREVDTSRLIDIGRTYNYPNPAEYGSTTIRVFVESAEKVDIMIYDIAGYFVKRLTIDSPAQGEVNEVVWDVTNMDSGVYFANVMATSGNQSENKILRIAIVH